MAYTSLADLVKAHESAGNYTAVNPNSGAGGAYQFVPSTWRAYGSQAGVDLNQYPTAETAPAPVQDQVFAQTVGQRGLKDWTCPGCDPALNSYLAANPDAANLPVFGSQAPTGLGAVASGQPVVPAPAQTQAGPNPALMAAMMSASQGSQLSTLFSQAGDPLNNYYKSFMGTA